MSGSRDAEALALSLGRERIGARVPHPRHDVLVRGLDKIRLGEAARRVGLATTALYDAVEDIGDGVRAVVVKARMHANLAAPGTPTVLPALITADRAEATRRVRELEAVSATPFLQKFVTGRLMAYTVVADHGGRCLAAVQQESDGLWPTRTGSSVRARTVPVEPRLAERVATLMAELGWFGLAQLQFVRPPGGEPRLIDLNGRLYGSLALAVASGPNLPALVAALATGRPRRARWRPCRGCASTGSRATCAAPSPRAGLAGGRGAAVPALRARRGPPDLEQGRSRARPPASRPPAEPGPGQGAILADHGRRGPAPGAAEDPLAVGPR